MIDSRRWNDAVPIWYDQALHVIALAIALEVVTVELRSGETREAKRSWGVMAMGSGVIERIRSRVRWWYAETFGEHPRCKCGEKAQMFLSSEGYRCMMCYIRGQPYQGIGYARDLRPGDHFGDRSHETDGDLE